MCREPGELQLIGCLTGLIWTQELRLNMLTPKTNSLTYWQWTISHVMNGIIFCVCLTLAISVLQIVLRWCRKAKEREFALNMQLETEDRSEKKVPCRARRIITWDKKFGITEGSSVKELGLMWDLFMSASMRAAIHLGQNYTENTAVFEHVHVRSRIYAALLRDWCWKVLKRSWMWRSSTAMTHHGYKQWNLIHRWSSGQRQKVHIFWDSVLCLGKMSAPAEAVERWKGQLTDFQTTISNQELFPVNWCVRNRLRYLTAPLNLKSYLWLLDYGWMVFLR